MQSKHRGSAHIFQVLSNINPIFQQGNLLRKSSVIKQKKEWLISECCVIVGSLENWIGGKSHRLFGRLLKQVFCEAKGEKTANRLFTVERLTTLTRKSISGFHRSRMST